MSTKLKDCEEDLKKVRSELRQIKTERRRRREAAKARPRRPRVAAAPPLGAVPSRLTGEPAERPAQRDDFNKVGDRLRQDLMVRGQTAFEDPRRAEPKVEVRPNAAQGVARGSTRQTLEPQVTTPGVLPPEREAVQIRTPAVTPRAAGKSKPGVAAEGLSDVDLIVRRQTKRNQSDEAKSKLIGIERLIAVEKDAAKKGDLEERRVTAQNVLTRRRGELVTAERIIRRRGLEVREVGPVSAASTSRSMNVGRNPGADTAPPRDSPVTEVQRQEDVDRRVEEEQAEERPRKRPPPRVIRLKGKQPAVPPA